MSAASPSSPARSDDDAHASSAQQVRAFAPASVGNIGVGFDVLGHSIQGPRDVATVRRIAEPVVRIRAIRGDVPGADSLPLQAERNTAGQALISLREKLGLAHGFELELDKGIALGSGLGGSAASCVAALVAANALLAQPLSREALYEFALDGESVSSGSRHGDNVAPMLLGGVVMATSTRMIALSVPDWLYAVVVHPDQVLETRRARAVLSDPYPLSQVVRQSAHLALFLTGLQRDDAQLLREGLVDLLVEPRRAPLIPGFAEVKAAALEHGALGASISGAGPSCFAWFETKTQAQIAAAAMRIAFAAAGFDSRAYVTPVAGPRADVIGSV
ncbi:MULTISPECIES: homoserine kinase [unclassified Lysobacter]|uniref:homoserine kinase n=1 Tax=unclassified Lysobacter TaxID=2635362 RepID=UPI001BE84D6E|nr:MULTISPECIES: homoserine kinase [unclassified Lysobacter]MBT2746356.1 homoserine kinase [Lysobacter sp. ISL-42]MBT2751171.1 homoserine kinase [Lysobacter sp. ISL-50]MBT2775579.1 homoserine kinase [Lysobacter sp. ISL-54]MBT2779964.1 homoserine kinase [Lysobacter sp. ISL-52]